MANQLRRGGMGQRETGFEQAQSKQLLQRLTQERGEPDAQPTARSAKKTGLSGE